MSVIGCRNRAKPADLPPQAYWIPRHLVTSAWTGHGPFAAVLMALVRPRVLVELGTHNGFSFFAFAEAARRLKLDTKLFAVDTWQGDEQAGFYGEEVFESVRTVAAEEYAESSVLLRKYFSEAVSEFADGSIDVLHIDGRHGYSDVKEDFEAYRVKLSSKAVVVFHDTNEFQEGFGVNRFWDELKFTGPSFAFLHSHGLGVLAYGAEVSEDLLGFLDRANMNPEETRSLFSTLGSEVANYRVGSEAAVRLPQAETSLALLDEELKKVHLNLETTVRAHSVVTAELEELNAEIASLRASNSWRLTAPFRRIAAFRKR